MYSVDWASRRVSIPVSDLNPVSVPNGEYELDMENFHEEIRRLEWEFIGGLFSDQIIEYTLPFTIAGTTFAPVIRIINGYTFEFPASINAVNLVGANTNLFELDITPPNGVSIRPNNSAGNTVTTINTGSGVTQQDKLDIAEEVWSHTR